MKRAITLTLLIAMLINCLPQTAEAGTALQMDIIAAGWDSAGVLLPDGTLLSWGNNEFGEIGNYTNGDYDYQTYDKLVLKPNAALQDVKSVKNINGSVYAIRKDNSLWAWGFNCYGKLGNGNDANQSVPVKILEDVKFVAGGHGLHAMAITMDGTLWAWGWNDFYQLGDGTNISRFSPVKVMEHVKYASVGYGYSAVIKSDNSLWTWGDNSFGNLGNGNKEDQKTPVKILENVQAVSLGQTGGYALKKDNTLWAWGDNQNGELGDGTKSSRLKPVKIMSDVANISSMGLFHFMALKEDGTLWTWGVNNEGQLGNGTTSSKSKPFKVMSDVIGFNNGLDFSFALKKDNTLWAWGNNECGQLGTRDQKSRLKPTKILDLDTYGKEGDYSKPARYIDGYLNDWEDTKPVISDETGDCAVGTVDLKDVYVYKDKRYLYLALTADGELSETTFFLDNNRDGTEEYRIIYDVMNNNTCVLNKDGRVVWTDQVNNYNDILELRIPLSAVGKPKQFYLKCGIYNTKDYSVLDETDGWHIIK